MQPNRTTLAIPGDSLADLDLDVDDRTAANLLALWTALWDPALLVQTRALPAARSVDTSTASQRSGSEWIVVPAAVTGEFDDDAAVVCCPEFVRRQEFIPRLGERLDLRHELAGPLAADFYAFGFAYLQVELLTRSLHYDTKEAQESLRTALVSAADAAIAGDQVALATHLDAAYDYLTQRRNHYYPIDFYLVDLLLCAPSVARSQLVEAARRPGPTNLLVTGELLDYLAANEADTLAAVCDAIEAGRIATCGGSMTDRPLGEFDPEGLLAELRSGLAACERHLGTRPTVFAHMSGPFAPLVPSVLYKLGYHATVTTDFAHGTGPLKAGSRTTWTGLDNTPVEALAAAPIDAGSSAAMLRLAKSMQRTMNYDLAASLLLVGWPGHRTESHDDLMRVAQRSWLLGRPVTLDDYFDVTTSHDHAGPLDGDAYAAASTLVTVDASDDRLAALSRLADAASATVEAIGKRVAATSSDGETGTLWINGSSHRAAVPGGMVPPLGWFWHANTAAASPSRCEPGVLRNEQLEVVFDPQTGGISATRSYTERGNFLSQQLVLVPLGPQGMASGLQLAGDGWEVVESSSTRGVLKSSFRIVDRDGKTLGEVEQLSSLAAGAQMVDVDVNFRPTADRAQHCELYSRIAVRDVDYSLTRGLQGIDLPTNKAKLIAAWLGIGGPHMPVGLLADQPRLHRRHGDRMLDTLVAPAGGESATAHLSYVLDCRRPAQAYAQHRGSEQIWRLPSAAVQQPSGWWLHWGAASVMLTHLSVETLEGELVVRLRLVETAGRPVETTLAAWRAIADARRVDFRGQPEQLLTVVEGDARLSMSPYEFVEVELLLAPSC